MKDASLYWIRDVAAGVANILGVMCDAAEAEGDKALASSYAIMADALNQAIQESYPKEGDDDEP